MINKPRYKTARRLGNNVFEKTQGDKFATREARRKVEKRSRPKSDFGLQMLEKQKAKVTYGVQERMFAKYVKSILDKAGANSPEKLISILESRLDNVVYRYRFCSDSSVCKTNGFSRSHIKVNEVRITVPSYAVHLGDKVTIRESSSKKPLICRYR
jgi:small subunit ribosomal protein S4